MAVYFAISSVPSQVGGVSANHSPLRVQILTLRKPLSSKPGLQEYSALLPSIVPSGVTTTPLSGSSRGPQSTADELGGGGGGEGEHNYDTASRYV